MEEVEGSNPFRSTNLQTHQNTALLKTQDLRDFESIGIESGVSPGKRETGEKKARVSPNEHGLKPLAIDLCCGKGGWTRGLIDSGFRVIGFDLIRYPEYLGEFHEADVRVLARSVAERHLNGWFGVIAAASVIVASPRCQEFSRHDMPWTRKLNPPSPDLSIVRACVEISRETGVPLVLENVRGSRKFLEPLLGAARSCGSFFLYGNGVPALLPKMYRAPAAGVPDRELARKLHCRYSPRSGAPSLRPGEHESKERMPHNAADRAVIPYSLARWIGEVYMGDKRERKTCELCGGEDHVLVLRNGARICRACYAALWQERT